MIRNADINSSDDNNDKTEKEIIIHMNDLKKNVSFN